MTTTPTSGAADLRTAAQAVVDRWDTPLWKDVPATAEYIGRLRAALAAGQAAAAQAVVPAENDTAYAELPESDIAVGNDGRALIYTSKDIVGEPYYTAGQLRAFADATHALRASHWQAPAQPDLGKLNGLAKQYADSYASPHHFTLGVNGLRQIIQRALPQAAPAAPADSVLEDAARYRFLRDGEWRDTDLEPFIRLQLNTLWDATIDAAHKQGEKQ